MNALLSWLLKGFMPLLFFKITGEFKTCFCNSSHVKCAGHQSKMLKPVDNFSST